MQSIAFVAGADDAQAGALKVMARQVGFRTVHTFRGVPDIERLAATAPMLFVLFPAVGRLASVARTVDQIRGSADDRVRFAPLVYFAESPSLEAIRGCIDIGFDDIVTLPYTLRRVAERLGRQLDRPLAYFQTASYFGPDRRDRLPTRDDPPRGSGGDGRRFEVVRSEAFGIRVTAAHERQVMV